MDSFEWNKIFGALLAALLISQLIRWGVDEAFHKHYPEEAAYKIEVPEPVVDGAEVPAGPNLPLLLAEASASKGETTFKKCTACHNAQESGAHGTGPNLWNVVGQDIAGKSGYSYSSAIQGVEGVWDYERLFAWLENPQNVASGSKMVYKLPKPADRAAIIAYLAAQSTNPPPLPEVADVSE